MSVKKKKTLTNFPFSLVSFGRSSSSSSSSSSSRASSPVDAAVLSTPHVSSCSSSSASSARTDGVILRSRDCRNYCETDDDGANSGYASHMGVDFRNSAAAGDNGDPTYSAPTIADSSTGSPRASTPSPWFPWCGFLFHESTLEVRMDLSRYKAPFSFKEMKKSVSLNYDRKRRWTLRDVKVGG